MGYVTLIGAGPGDVRLITVAARDAIRNADVIVYDRLANPDLLMNASPHAETVYAGKDPGGHTVSQDMIHEILIKHARDGKNVVRLKGGDPFLFGRGLEEMQYCLKHGVPCSALPGIPAAVALSSTAGIPLTDRRTNSMLHIVTGHSSPDSPSPEVQWDLLAKSEGVIVIYMGIGNLSANMDALLAAGYPPSIPAAVVENISLPGQRVVKGTAGTICSIVDSSGVKPPALVILGKTVELAADVPVRRGLSGRRIILTRASDQAAELASRLSERGAFVQNIPLISIHPADDYSALDDAVATVSRFQWILFTSPNGVQYFMKRLFHMGFDIRTLSGIAVGAIGSGTASRLMEYGIRADHVPKKYTSSAFVDSLAEAYSICGNRILLPRSDIAPNDMIIRLEGHGAAVEPVTAYRTVSDLSSSELLIDTVKQGSLDMITFTSSSTVHSFAELLGTDLMEAFRDSIHAASIGPETSTALKQHGIKPALEADEHSIDGLYHAICSYFEETD